MVRAAGRDQRERVLRAATKLFRKNGFHATSMEDIAAAVKLNKGSLYYYFPGKNELLFAVFAASIEEARAVLPDLAALPPEEGVRQFVRHQLATVSANEHQAAVYFQESRFIGRYFSASQYREVRSAEAEISEALVKCIERGVKNGTFRAIDAWVTAQSLIGTCAWVSSWWQKDSAITLDAVADHHVDLVLGGMLA